MTRIAIRTDGSATKGLGNLIRSLGIAKALRKRGAEVIFFCEDDPIIHKKLIHTKESFPVHRKSRSISWCEEAFIRSPFEGIESYHADVLVIDIKRITYSVDLINDLRFHGPVVMIDPFRGQGMFHADLTVFTNAHQDPETLDKRHYRGKLLHGAEYAVLNEHILGIEPSEKPEVPGILLTTGGADPHRIMLQVLSYLQNPNGHVFNLYVMLGESFRHGGEVMAAVEAMDTANPGEVVIFAPHDLRKYLSHVTHAVCTFGITPYELAYLGIPTLTIANLEENIWGSRNFEQLGMSVDGGSYRELTADKFAVLLRQLLDRDWTGWRIEGLDGLGAERVADAILALAENREVA